MILTDKEKLAEVERLIDGRLMEDGRWKEQMIGENFNQLFSDKVKVLHVEARLQGLTVEVCPCMNHGPHSVEGSDLIITGKISHSILINPCKSHIDVYVKDGFPLWDGDNENQ